MRQLKLGRAVPLPQNAKAIAEQYVGMPLREGRARPGIVGEAWPGPVLPHRCGSSVRQLRRYLMPEGPPCSTFRFPGGSYGYEGR